MKTVFSAIASMLLLTSLSSAQTVKISGGAVLVPNGSTTPDYYNLTNFGAIPIGTTKRDNYFRVHTTSAITIPSAPSLSGPDAGDFQVLTVDTSAGPDDPALFDIRFSPQTPGIKTATVTMTSSAGAYTFAITGRGVDGTPDPAPNPEFNLGKSKRKGKVNKNTGDITLTISDGFTNQGELPTGPAMVSFYYSEDYTLDPGDLFLAESLVKKSITIPKQTNKGPKYKIGTGKMKANIPSQNGYVITQVRLTDQNIVEPAYSWNTVYYPLEFIFR